MFCEKQNFRWKRFLVKTCLGWQHIFWLKQFFLVNMCFWWKLIFLVKFFLWWSFLWGNIFFSESFVVVKKSCFVWPSLAKFLQGQPSSAQFCQALPSVAKYSQVYPRVAKFGKVWPNLAKFSQAYPRLAQFIQVKPSFAKFTNIYQSVAPWVKGFPKHWTLCSLDPANIKGGCYFRFLVRTTYTQAIRLQQRRLLKSCQNIYFRKAIA